MRKLKTYKVFEQESKIREDIEDIKDIFLELRDLGWIVKHFPFVNIICVFHYIEFIQEAHKSHFCLTIIL